jgi:acetyl-CoA C-acetyltransferase
MPTAYIVDAVRTAGGKRGGKLAGWHPGRHGGAVFDAIVDRNGFRSARDRRRHHGLCQPGRRADFQVGRGAVLASKLPDSFPPSRSTASADRRSRRCSSPRRR